MTEKKKERQVTAPYATWTALTRFLDEMAEKGVPQQIDRTVMSRMSGANQSAIRVTMSFMGLTDADGVPTMALKALVAKHGQGKEWEDALRAVVIAAYEPVIGDLSLKTGTSEQLWKCFKERGNVSGSTHIRAVRFFLAAAKDLGVKHSRYFKAPQPRRRPQKADVERERAPEAVDSTEPGENPRDPGGRHKVSGSEDRLDIQSRSDWRLHRFYLPAHEYPVEVVAPKGITMEEWGLVNPFMEGTIKLARAVKPSPADDSADEG